MENASEFVAGNSDATASAKTRVAVGTMVRHMILLLFVVCCIINNFSVEIYCVGDSVAWRGVA